MLFRSAWGDDTWIRRDTFAGCPKLKIYCRLDSMTYDDAVDYQIPYVTEGVSAYHAHTWGAAQMTVSPTCSAAGVNTFVCTRCGGMTTEAIAQTAHVFEIITTAAGNGAAGSKVEKCKICGAINSSVSIWAIGNIALAKDAYTYTGKEIRPEVTVRDAGGNVIPSAFYTVSYRNNKSVGAASVTVTFQGDYSGTQTKNFAINPRGTTISKLTGAKKGMTVKWKKQSAQTSGYEIQYSTSKKFTGKVTKTTAVKKASATSVKIKKLSAKKKYYVRIRTYKTVAGKKYCSEWSKAKNVTTKK